MVLCNVRLRLTSGIEADRQDEVDHVIWDADAIHSEIPVCNLGTDQSSTPPHGNYTGAILKHQHGTEAVCKDAVEQLFLDDVTGTRIIILSHIESSILDLVLCQPFLRDLPA